MNTNIKSFLFIISIVVLTTGLSLCIANTVSASTVGNWYKDPFGVRAFVNSKMGNVIGSETALRLDSTTALKICQLAGYNSVVSMDCVSTYDGGRCGYYSCGDNYLAYWDTSSSKFITKNSCTMGNKWISSLVCGNATINCSSSSDCGTSAYTGSPFCQSGNVYQNYITYTCNNPGTTSSTCSNATAAKLKTTCTTNQTCTNGSCVDQTINCSSSSDCGTSGYIGSAFCSGGDVYKTYKTYTCNNAGTVNSYCSNSTQDKLFTDCASGQICSNGSCTDEDIACDSSSDCGTSGYIGSAFCSGGDVYKTYKTYTCNNAGTTSSYCSNSTQDKLYTDCTSTQTCSGGTCSDQDIACDSSSDCGTSGYIGSAFCSGGDVYKTYRTYKCNNAGTTSAYCSNTSEDKLYTNCSSTQTCSNGSCSDQDIACDSSSDCGTSGYIGSAFCSGGDVYKTYRTYTCNNAGTTSSYCYNTTSDKLYTDCGSSTCSNGSCSSNNCTDHSYQQCSGNYLYWYDSCGNQDDLIQYCSNGCYNNSCNNQTNLTVQTYSATNTNNNQATLNGYVYGYNYGNGSYYNNYVWFQWGTSTSYGSETTHQTMSSSGSFSQIVNLYSSNTTYHYRAVAQNSNGNLVYGNDMTFTAGSTTNGSLSITETVRNLTTGSAGFSNTVYASPSDMLMFMITIQTTGNQSISNLYLKDTLPANLIYKNNLIVSGSSNYSGDIISGMNFGTINNGQTVTITYQAQVADAANFAYGTTTLNNSISATGSSSYVPTTNASTVVTRSAVYGASTISTGLTNNFWTDSFLLPLLIALAGIWMLRSGMFFGAEKWIDSKRKKTRSYRAEKELNSRIAEIRELEQN